MIRSDESEKTEDGGNRSAFRLMELSQDQIDADWAKFNERHIDPTRLFRLAVGMLDETVADRQHLEWCDCCRNAYEGYRLVDEPTEDDASETPNRLSGVEQKTLHWDESSVIKSNGKKSRISDDSHGRVPDILREHFRVVGPVLFPGEEVAFESWQFGRLTKIHCDNPQLENQLLETMCARAESHLIEVVNKRHLTLVCFGRPMHRLGTRLAAGLVDRGFSNPHVILAHDFYSPTFVCDPKEFRNADVVVLVDVVHTGAMLDRLMASCKAFGPEGVRGLALIDQSQGKILCREWTALWSEPREHRVPLSKFLHEATVEQRRKLQRFEPNDGYSADSSPVTPVDDRRLDTVSIDPLLVKYIHVTGACKRDHAIGGKCYPYAINVLDLLRKDVKAKEFVLGKAVIALSDLGGHKTCFAYHAGRSARAGVIAQLLSDRLKWPTFAIGTGGSTFALTARQCAELARYETVVITEAAVRTGDSVCALAAAFKDEWLRKNTRLVFFSVLDALSNLSRHDLELVTGCEIRALFRLPLAPPTAEVRHWTKLQKSLIREKILKSGEFSSIKRSLGRYLEPPSTGRRDDGGADGRTIEQTTAMLHAAIAHAQASREGVKIISAACGDRTPSRIRHLTVDEVIHDSRVQDLLLGIMYNSMNPTFKESAAFGLAAAENYEWMELEWLKCNRKFFSSRSNAWKCVPIIECEMKMKGHTSKLATFRAAAIEYYEHAFGRYSEPTTSAAQLTLLETEEREPVTDSETRKRDAIKSRLRQRLDVVIEAAAVT